MQLEHLNGEQGQSIERSEHKFEDLESERPSEIELPGIVDDATEGNVEREDICEDSERETVELPHIEEENVMDTTDSKTDTSSNVSENTELTNEQKDVQERYYSTYEERINQTPSEVSNRGEWSGERGESEFIPNDSEIKKTLNEHGLDGISYADGIPDFSGFSECTVEIDNMTEKRSSNFEQCDNKCAKQWNEEGREEKTDWSARDVQKWRGENGYSWHERNDMKTCDLVPTQVNDYFGHLGGVGECRRRDAVTDFGGEFDE